MSDESKPTCILPTCSRPATHQEPDANAVGGVIHWCDVHWPRGAEPIRTANDEAKRIVAEETWEASDHLVCTIEPPSPKNGSTGRQILAADDMCGPTDYADHADEARARIAACAPEALRMLLDNEWAGGGQPSGYCLDCGAPQSAQHSEHCRWMALMRKAGLR